MNFIDLIKLNSYEAVLNADHEYQYRKICRWFSKTFHTPLADVEKMDQVYIFTTYYEHAFEEMPREEFYKLFFEMFVDGTEDEEKELDEFAKSLESLQEQTLKNKTQSSNKGPELPEINLSFNEEE